MPSLKSYIEYLCVIYLVKMHVFCTFSLCKLIQNNLKARNEFGSGNLGEFDKIFSSCSKP